MIAFAPYLPYIDTVLYSLAFLLLALLTFPVIIGMLVGCAIALRTMWTVYREGVRRE